MSSVNFKIKGLEEKALFLLENYKAYSDELILAELISRDKKSRAIFLPVSTTSILQLLDQGVISIYKRNYRRELITKIHLKDIEKPF